MIDSHVEKICITVPLKESWTDVSHFKSHGLMSHICCVHDALQHWTFDLWPNADDEMKSKKRRVLLHLHPELSYDTDIS